MFMGEMMNWRLLGEKTKRSTSSTEKKTVQMMSRTWRAVLEVITMGMTCSTPWHVVVTLCCTSGRRLGNVSRQKPAMDVTTKRKETMP